jgi:hypothetical protein
MAAIAVPRVIVGKIALVIPLRPLTGVSPSQSEKTSIRIGPIQKFGMETPSMEKPMALKSVRLSFFSAAVIPSGSAITMAKIKE